MGVDLVDFGEYHLVETVLAWLLGCTFQVTEDGAVGSHASSPGRHEE